MAKLAFSPMGANELDMAFQLYKSALQPVIESAFGWDDVFQRERFFTRYEPHWFHWIEVAEKRIGYICYHSLGLPTDPHSTHAEEPFSVAQKPLHLSLLIIGNEFRGKAYGHAAMMRLHELAKESKITLSSFKVNERAIRFYERLGYVLTNSDEHFVDMEWSASSSAP